MPREEEHMAKKATKHTARRPKQDRALAGRQDYEVRHETRKTGCSTGAVKKVGNKRNASVFYR